MSTATGSNGCGVRPGGAVCPSPVRKSTTVLPLAAGFARELSLWSWFNAAARPLPDPSAVKIAGSWVELAIH